MLSPYAPLIEEEESKKNEVAKRRSQELIDQLPDELKLYLQYPEEKELPVVKYSFMEKIVRAIAIGLSSLLFGYPVFKMQLVRKGQIGLAWHGDEPYLLGPGRHVLLSPTSQLEAIRDINEPFIEHGSLKIVRIREGQLG